MESYITLHYFVVKPKVYLHVGAIGDDDVWSVHTRLHDHPHFLLKYIWS